VCARLLYNLSFINGKIMSIANTQSETIVEAGIIEDNDQVQARIEHLKELEKLIGNSYPNKFERTKITGAEDTISNVLNFEEITKHIPKLADGEKPAPEVKEEINRKLKEFGSVRIAGRLATPPRTMGKAAFVHLSDGAKRLQIYVRRDDVKGVANDGKESEANGWEMFKLFDHGDFVGVEGFLFLTNTGELSVHVEKLQFLAKAMLPMPDKIHGIADPELQRRFRYADLIADSLKIDHAENELTTREVFERRTKLISGMRRFLDDAGFIEVETPMLTPKATGAAARAFETFHEALKIPLYARIAPELYLKRLTVGGFEKVYELNRNFRNEGLSQKHNPEFTMLEFYCAYMDVNGMMDFCEAILKESVRKATGGSLQVKYGENEIDFSDFKRVSMKDAVAKIELALPNIDEVKAKFQNPNWINDKKTVYCLKQILLGIKRKKDSKNLVVLHKSDEDSIGPFHKEKEIEKVESSQANDYSTGITLKHPESAEDAEEHKRKNWLAWGREFDTLTFSDEDLEKSIIEIFELVVESKLIQPTFIIDYPKSISPLSKASPENPQIAERFELFINGMECANGFSELNDPQEQYERFREQTRERETGDDEAMVMDEDYIRALSYGMPPAAGIGIGIDRLVMLLTNRHSIRDVILFPHMRPENREEENEAQV
jgi:lysyl-tRNA synthetase class 2